MRAGRVYLAAVSAALAASVAAGATPSEEGPVVAVQKCCERTEIMVTNHKCRFANETGEDEWEPEFADENGKVLGRTPAYSLRIGVPGCGPRQHWSVYHNRLDRLILLPDGRLRHYTISDAQHVDDEELSENHRYHDYKLGFYCIDKKLETDTGDVSQFAIVCAPKISPGWRDTDFILRKIIDPTFHVTGIICYTSVALIHFVLPQLRDLVGNIITTMSICMVISQSADLVRIFTELSSPIGFLFADIIMFISLLSAFLWLSSLGFYIWKTFRSRNVFLRITDGKKYCYYSYCVWTCTAAMSLLAIFSHFMLDTPDPNTNKVQSQTLLAFGWLGIAVFFCPIAFTVFGNIYFYIATLHTLGHMSSYGRIHHKLKLCFETFLKLFIIMTIGWICLLFSWLPYRGLYYVYIITNALEAPLILYVSVLCQVKVRYLLKKACCYDNCLCTSLRPEHTNDAPDWGEEMMAMNR